MTSDMIIPSVSTTIWRLRPFTFFAAIRWFRTLFLLRNHFFEDLPLPVGQVCAILVTGRIAPFSDPDFMILIFMLRLSG